MAQAGDVFPSVLKELGETSKPNNSQQILLPPEQSLVFHLNFRTAEKMGNLKYTIIPELVVTASGTEQTIPLREMEATLTYADPDQVSCNTLQGNQFVPLKQEDIETLVREGMLVLCQKKVCLIESWRRKWQKYDS